MKMLSFYESEVPTRSWTKSQSLPGVQVSPGNLCQHSIPGLHSFIHATTASLSPFRGREYPRCPKKMQRLQPSIPAQVHHFTIAKFSHTRTLIDHVGPLNWNHVTGDGDLLCIFERIADPNQVSSSLIQKVLRGNDMLVRSPLLEPATKLIRFDCCRSKSILSIRFELQQCPPSSSRHPSHTLLSS